MYGDNASTDSEPTMQSPQALYRGLYIRIAKKLSVDPSYVSRVARGERHSRSVEDALQQELQSINKRLGRGASAAKKVAGTGSAPNRLKTLTRRHRSHVRKQWLRHSQADPNLRKIKIAP